MYSLHTILDTFPRHKSRMQSIHILSTSFNNHLLHSRRVLHCFAQMKPKTRLFQGGRTFSTGIEKPAFCRLYPVAVTATGFTYWKSRQHQNTIQPFSQVSIPSCRPGNWGNILIWWFTVPSCWLLCIRGINRWKRAAGRGPLRPGVLTALRLRPRCCRRTPQGWYLSRG